LQIQEINRKFIHKNFIPDEKDPFEDEDSLLEKGVIDPTGVSELASSIEERYGLTVEDEEWISENLDSIRNIAEFIWPKTKTSCKAEVGQSVAP
jgi:acyl carrier protein